MKIFRKYICKYIFKRRMLPFICPYCFYCFGKKDAFVSHVQNCKEKNSRCPNEHLPNTDKLFE
uniref:C2H2-type domain-containing protein n=1 Tax=Marseillevirus sp. TaxID=2809551 RepID=A0AA96EN99_9VIRU|nr:hypothetical protein MarDSR_159 [Marseillevirus sp.]